MQRETGKRKKERIFLKNFFPHNKKPPFLDGFRKFFWFLHNAIILLMERECNVSFFTKKSPGPQRKNEAKKSGNEKNTKNRNMLLLRP